MRNDIWVSLGSGPERTGCPEFSFGTVVHEACPRKSVRGGPVRVFRTTDPGGTTGATGGEAQDVGRGPHATSVREWAVRLTGSAVVSASASTRCGSWWNGTARVSRNTIISSGREEMEK